MGKKSIVEMGGGFEVRLNPDGVKYIMPVAVGLGCVEQALEQQAQTYYGAYVDNLAQVGHVNQPWCYLPQCLKDAFIAGVVELNKKGCSRG